MAATEVIEYRREQIKRFICITNLGKENETFRVDFDNLVKYLIRAPEIRFAASQYEALLSRELQSKVINRVLTPEAMNIISDYMWDLALYCSSLMLEKDNKDEGMTKNRAVAKHELAERLKSGKLQ